MESNGLDPFNEGLDSKGKYYAMVVLSMKKLLLDDTFSDLVIYIGKESVQAHAGIVCVRCPELIGFPQDDKKKASKKKLEVKLKDSNVASGSIMTKVLEFLYTGMVDFPKVSDKEILLLIGAARFFKLNRLCYLCERWLREHMTIESVFHLLKDATDLNESRVKGFCLSFALAHYNEFISNKDGIYILGIELFQEVVAAFQSNPTPPPEMKAEENPDTLIEDFQKLYNQMPYSDITLQIRGESIKAHRSILAAHSDAFVSTIFKDESGLSITPKAFHSMLQFTYFGNDKIDALPSCELVEFSRKYKLPSLLKICEDKIRTSVALDTVLPILSISYLPADGKQELVDELRSKCFPFILENLSRIDLAMIKASHPLLVIDLLFEIQLAWKSGKYGIGSNLPAFASSLGSGSSDDGSNSAPQRQQPPPPNPRSGFGTKSPSFEAGRPSTSSNSGGGLLGAQRRGPAPPPSGRGRGRGRGAPAGTVRTTPPRDRPEPPARSTSQQTFDAPPPSSMAPKPPTRSQPPPPSTGSGDPKNKKEEDKRKKEELKRVTKEKKERAKMEKKFKPKGGKDIY